MNVYEQSSHIADLLFKRLESELTPEEAQVIAAWETEAPSRKSAADALLHPSFLPDWLEQLDAADAHIRHRFGEAGVPIAVPEQAIEQPVVVHRVHFLRTAWFRYAAILLLIAGTATYLYVHNGPQKEITTTTADAPSNIQPGGNKAVLTLADGSTILLDSAATGNLATQGATKIIKLEAGKLAYQGSDRTGTIGYNTISTPNGGQYQVVLPDGSRVWLNAASSVRFPTQFAGERHVTITGEAYLDIVPNPRKSFSVTAAGAEIQVLGTGFNVNAYPEETTVQTTLVEGSVKVTKRTDQPTTAVELRPGQQARVGNASFIHIVADADLEQVTAWKNGVFNFNGLSLEQAMRLLSKWYDIEVVYPNGVPNLSFSGKIKRNLPYDKALHFLGAMGLNYIVDTGRRLIVLP